MPCVASVMFHTSKVPYVIQKTYNPDFTITYPDGKIVFVEAKGYFQDAQEIQKYDWIRDALPEDQELVFVFENPKKPIHFRSKRKDGTKMSHGEWADKLKFRHYTLETMGELIT